MIRVQGGWYVLSEEQKPLATALVLRCGSMDHAVNMWYFQQPGYTFAPEEEELLAAIHDAQAIARLD